jgi:hypothetical protein
MNETLTQRDIARFWAPLAATWLMMSVEGPFLSAVIARLAEPKYNLAAWGIAFSFAMIVEAPIIMVLSASTALVADRESFLTLRRFVYTLNGLITAAMLAFLLPPVFHFVTRTLMNLPPRVAGLAHSATLLLLPWPAAIGYRRFYQGTLLRHGMPRRVAYGTAFRVATMGVAGLVLYRFAPIPGAWVGAAALSVGVVMEAAASRIMARPAVRAVLQPMGAPLHPAEPLTVKTIIRFYYPLALTSLLTLGVNPLVTFSLGRSRMALESLAVMPVVTALVFAFRSPGIAYQEVGVALLGVGADAVAGLRRFAATLGVSAAGALAVVAWTPLAAGWFHRVSGLSPELTRLAITPLRILCLYPAFEVLLSFQRARLVHVRRTAAITWGTAVEVAAIVVVLSAGIGVVDLVGAVVAAVALLTARLAANSFLAYEWRHRSVRLGAGDQRSRG